MDLTVWPYRNLAYHLAGLHRSLLTWRQWAGEDAAWPRSASLRLTLKPRSGDLVWQQRHFSYRLAAGGGLDAFHLPESGPDFDFLALTRDLAALNARVIDLTQDLQESQLDLGLLP
jgi:hypothetical protein